MTGFCSRDELTPSFEDLYRRTWGLMVPLARLLVDDREEAVEVVQDAFSRMYPKFDRVEAQSTDAYLRATVLKRVPSSPPTPSAVAPAPSELLGSHGTGCESRHRCGA